MTRFRPIGIGHGHFQRRLILIAIIAGLLGGALFARMVWLQLIEASHYTALARGNRIRVPPIAPTRGLIYDRNGILLAENLPAYELTLTPDQVPHIQATLKRLRALVDLTANDLKNFKHLRQLKKSFQPVPLKTDLTPGELARFAVNRQDFPGIDVHATLKRYYPTGTDAAAVVGYEGLLSIKDLQRLDADEYRASAHVGKTGIEWQYETLLHGKVGYRQVEVNASGRVLRTVSTTPSVPGKNLYLTIDDRLQQAAFKALAGQPGAVVALDPRSGAVLCLVSSPGYDPNLFVNGISNRDYQALLHRPEDPLVDRALRGRYAPGSTVKPFIGLAALYYGILQPSSTIYAGPTFTLPNFSHVWHNWNPYQNSKQTIQQAIVRSTDTFFYQVADKLGIDRIHAFLHRFGFGVKPPIDLPGALAGINPSPAWKMKALGKPWYLGETINNGIGQGYFQVTPLQLAWATATLAAHGRHLRPHVLAASVSRASGQRTDTQAQPLATIALPEPADWNYMLNAMHQVVENPHGTAHRIAKGLTYSLAGKTGTAQVTSVYHSDFAPETNIPWKLRDNALFIAIAPVQHPTIAVAVVVEHGGGGATAAAPIARKVIDAWMHGDDKPETPPHVSQPH
ncbi:MAG: penicillin-binding protein 2 [Gammaproteobacteria bacterium]